MGKKKVCLTEEEILKNSNDNILGSLVRQKLWKIKSNKTKSWIQKLKNLFSLN